MPPTNLIDQLVRDEGGAILHAYQDQRGYWTIGVGTLIDSRAGGGITRDEAMYLLANRIEIAQAQVRTQIPWSLALDDVRRAVLENMAFNEGIEHLLGFRKMSVLIQTELAKPESERDFTAASEEGLNSVWATQVGDRAHRLMQQLKTGQWI